MPGLLKIPGSVALQPPEGICVAASGSAAPFDPSSLSGLVGWWKADGITGAEGDPVATWTDSSAAGNNATQATGTKQPLLRLGVLNAKPVVRFDGTDDYLSAVTPAGATKTVFVVAKRNGANSTQRVWGFASNAAGLYDNAGVWGYYPDQANAVVAVGGDTTVFQVVSASYASSSSAAIRVNGGSAVTFDPNDLYTGVALFGLGCSTPTSGADPWKGDIAEALVYSVALSSADRASVEAYLKSKWGTA